MASWGSNCYVQFLRARVFLRTWQDRIGMLLHQQARHCVRNPGQLNCFDMLGPPPRSQFSRLMSANLWLPILVGLALMVSCVGNAGHDIPEESNAELGRADALAARSGDSPYFTSSGPLVPPPIPTPLALPLGGQSRNEQGRLVIRPSRGNESSEPVSDPAIHQDLEAGSDSIPATPALTPMPMAAALTVEEITASEDRANVGDYPGSSSLATYSGELDDFQFDATSPPSPTALALAPWLNFAPTIRPSVIPLTTPTPVAYPTPAITPSPTLTPVPTDTPTQAFHPTATPTRFPTPTTMPTATPTSTHVPTLSPTATATPSPTPTNTPTPRPTSTPTSTPYPAGAGVVIECIFYDGEVPRSEADEYVQIKNGGASSVDLKSWKLADLGPRGPEFTFDGSYVLPAGGRIRVYTNEVHNDWGGFSFARGTAIWRNDLADPDTAGLFNPSGTLVSEKSYPPGC